jgi:hypothetical protein
VWSIKNFYYFLEIIYSASSAIEALKGCICIQLKKKAWCWSIYIVSYVYIAHKKYHLTHWIDPTGNKNDQVICKSKYEHVNFWNTMIYY